MGKKRSELWDGDAGEVLYAKVKALWYQGVKVADIAQRLGIPTNVISGKTHRNRHDFPRRLDPIIRTAPRAPAKPKARIKVTLPPIVPAPEPFRTSPPPIPAPAPIVTAPRRQAPRPLCAYPTMSKSGRVIFDCTEPAIPRSVYCAVHHSRTHVKSRSTD